ncbi:MAG: tRNA (adenosine(37)-N6)-threonylcarbamoyltransferase complex ATPase subunit type 1 TsaE [Alphaproteobacteria bacterium]|nr:tRNA (adenosine(37)-N6)-threonylcarbamoyltransferase complex ATPase subunit type 1 TsaE [Alphaproteobacteria bacterium]
MAEFILNNVEEMRAWARDFAGKLSAPCVVALHGDLGMGKSEIARCVIQTLRGADTVVPSPTFTIVQSYDGISHFDLYRIEDADELVEVGLEHAMQNDITLIEWPEIADGMLPADTINIFITQHGDGRCVCVR